MYSPAFYRFPVSRRRRAVSIHGWKLALQCCVLLEGKPRNDCFREGPIGDQQVFFADVEPTAMLLLWRRLALARLSLLELLTVRRGS